MKFFILLFFSFSLLFSQSNFKEIKTQYFKSYDYEQMGRYTEAIKVLAPLYKQYPNGYTLNLRFGWLFFLNKKYNDAIKYYKKASLSNSYALDPRLGLIRIYLQTQDYEKAQTVSYELLKIDYYNYYANLYISKALIAQKKYDIAHNIIKKMLALYPTDITYLEQLAVIYKQTHSNYLQQVYEDILILDPNNVYVRSEMK
jgi:tetratricopeptide (TPR) repeat protein